MKTYCKVCGGDDVEYLNTDDGGGPYGESICDQYECHECGNRFEKCYSDDLYEDEEEWPVQSEASRAVDEFIAEDWQREVDAAGGDVTRVNWIPF